MGSATFPRMKNEERFLEKPSTYGRNWYWLGFGALGAAVLLISVMAFLSLRSLDQATDTVRRDLARHEAALRSLIEGHPVLPRRTEGFGAFQDELQPLRDSVERLSFAFVDQGMKRLAEAEEKAGRTAGLALGAVGITTVFSLLLFLHLAKQVGRRLADSQVVLRGRPARLDAFDSPRNLTERLRAEEALKESEAKLRQSQKMEAMGQLAGGVVHDFNNLLTAINGYCQLTLPLVEKDGPAYENLQEIHKAGGRAATLTRQLLAYSRKKVVAPRVLNLNQVVGNIGNMLQRLIGDNISLFTLLEPELDLVKVDGGQVEQMLVNMILNARDSMPKGGRIEIRTRNVVLASDAEGMVLEADPGRYVVVEVADKGSGMSEEVQAHIFEPFFTTKSVGKGTGLGLSSVYGIVKEAAGGLKVESAEGQGSTFSIFFPALAAEALPRAEDEDALGAAHRGSGETLLLAEDEPAVKHFIRKTLESNGYQVIAAKDGQEALKKFQENGSLANLLVTDMVMPGMHGRELAEKIRESRPGLRVLFMSGYLEEAFNMAELQAKGDQFLAKPFSPDQLLQRVNEILRGQEAAP